MRKEKNATMKNCTTSSASSPPTVAPKFNNSLSNNQSLSDQTNANQRALTNLLVLNEVVIDRGPSPYLSNIDLYLDGKLIIDHLSKLKKDFIIKKISKIKKNPDRIVV